ncbi:unnamed protein product [Symbiodinium natans]|uniref:N-acetyltransferase domain-containing protein n=1 Tax=Symbiodinium natans TaxID=878477 RepID=A0A812QYI0_9DINO|nr:unnamed protein product [Symbiodinium natans]
MKPTISDSEATGLKTSLMGQNDSKDWSKGWSYDSVTFRTDVFWDFSGVAAGWVEARLAKSADKDQPESAEHEVALPDLSEELRRKNPHWRLIRLVLHAAGPDPVGAKRYPVAIFSVDPRLPFPTEPSKDVTVSVATEEDRVAWQRLFVEYRASQIPPGSPPYAPDEVAADAVWGMSCFHGRPLDAGTADILLARAEDGTLLGAATLVRLPKPPSSPSSTATGVGEGSLRGFLSDLFVDPRTHGKGVGRALMAKVLATCNDAGLLELCWYCLQSNEQAMSFYARLGFLPTPATVWQYPENDGT